MNTVTRLRPLVIAIGAMLAVSFAVPALAQQPQSTGESMRDARAKRMKELGKTKDAKQEEVAQTYPNATRKSPEAKAKGKNLKALQDLQALYEKQDYAGTMAKAEQIASASDASAYEKAFAYQIAGGAAAESNAEAKALDYFKKAIEADGLENNSHYQVMYNLAVVQYGQKKYEDALATLDRFSSETKSDKPELQQMRAGILANLGRTDDAVKAYQDQLAKNPNDKKALMNAVATYQQANEYDKATALLEDAYKKGLLTEPKELRALYVGYMNSERYKDAQAVIEAGVSKGTLTASPELAKDYMVLAQNAYFTGSDSDAIALYAKAAPMAADGEAYLNMAKLLRDQGKAKEAKAAAQQALDKGVQKPEEARQIIGG
jgi:tetratricopeptide (TPR) repeat protein